MFDRDIGEGYRKGGGTTPLHSRAALVVFVNGRPRTAYPLLEEDA